MTPSFFILPGIQGVELRLGSPAPKLHLEPRPPFGVFGHVEGKAWQKTSRQELKPVMRMKGCRGKLRDMKQQGLPRFAGRTILPFWEVFLDVLAVAQTRSFY